MVHNFIHSPTQAPGDYDYYDDINNIKSSGVIPFLKARKNDKANFFVSINFVNPHDIKESTSDLSQARSSISSQFWRPFNDEQVNEYNLANPENPIKNPYFFNAACNDAYIKNGNMITNFFENNYNDYKTKNDSINCSNSLFNDFCLNPKFNNITKFYVGFHNFIKDYVTCPDTPDDVKSWKNMINNYYGLVCEADAYVFEIYKELEKSDMLKNTNVIITSDHGEMCGSHGQREKGLPFNSNVNIPFLLYSPLLDESCKNTKSNYLGSSVDIIPTIMELSNFSNNKKQFNGESLVYLNNNKKFESKTIEFNSKKGVIHLQNATDALLTWFNFIDWYLNYATNEQKNSIIGDSLNFFDYRYSIIMTQTIYKNSKNENKLYKFGLLYSLKDLVEYNINYNKILITKEDILNNLPLNCDENLINIINSYNNLKSKNLLHIFIFLYNKTSNNIIFQFQFMYSIFKILDLKLTKEYSIPGCFDDFKTKKEKYDLFCYNLTDDEDEIFNLLDDKNYKLNDNLFNYLNKNLNKNIKLQKIEKIFTIIPYEQIFIITIDIIKSFLQSINESINLPIDLSILPFKDILNKLININTNNEIFTIIW